MKKSHFLHLSMLALLVNAITVNATPRAFSAFVKGAHYMPSNTIATAKNVLKADNGTKQRLDSIVRMKTWRNVCLYSGNNAIENYLTQKWDSVQKYWIDTLKENYTFNELNEMTDYERSIWDSTKKEWNTYWKEHYTYDQSGNATQYIGSSKDINGNWIDEWKHEYIFTAGKKEQYTASKKNTALNQWDIDWKETYNYDTNGKLIANEGTRPDLTDGHTVSGWKEEYSYDASGRSEMIGYVWDTNNKKWVSNWKESYSYDAKQNLNQTLGYRWLTQKAEWELSMKQNQNYNVDYSVSQLIIPYWLDTIWNSMLTETKLQYWDTVAKQWESQYTENYYYSEQSVVSEKENANDDILVSYDATNKLILINGKSTSVNNTLSIYNVQGEIIVHRSINGNAAIPIQNEVNGIYIYQIERNNSVISGKLIITK